MQQIRLNRVAGLTVCLLTVALVSSGIAFGSTPPNNIHSDAMQNENKNTGNLGLSSHEPNLTTGTYSGLSLTSAGSEVYSIELDAGESINVTAVTAADAPFDTAMEILDSQGDELEDSSYNSPDGELDETAETRLTYEADSSGIYYIRVEPRDVQYVDPPDNTDITYDLIYQTDTDRFEPNGALESAPELSTGNYSGLTLLSSETDTYAINLTAGESINVTAVTAADAPFDIEMEVLDSQGDELEDSSYNSPDGEFDETAETRLTHEADSTGTHYIRVGTRNVQYVNPPDNGHITYNLSYETDTDSYEPNGALESAPELSTGDYSGLTLLSSETDTYAINLTAGESINVTAVTAADAPFDTAMEVLDSQGDELEDSSHNSPDGELDETAETRLTYEADSSGTHYIRVGTRNAQYVDPPDNGHITYNLSYETDTDSYEPNGALESAPELSAGNYSGLTLLSSETDTYAINFTAGESINVTAVTAADAPFDTEMEVLDSQGDELEDSNYHSPDGELDETAETRLTYKADSTGRYYIRVGTRNVQYVDPPDNGHISYDLLVSTDGAPSTSTPTPPDTPISTATPPDTPTSTPTLESRTESDTTVVTSDEARTESVETDRNNEQTTTAGGPGFQIIPAVTALLVVIILSKLE